MDPDIDGEDDEIDEEEAEEEAEAEEEEETEEEGVFPVARCKPSFSNSSKLIIS